MKKLTPILLALLLLCACTGDNLETVELRDPARGFLQGNYNFESTVENAIRNSTHVAIVQLEEIEPYGEDISRSICTFSVQSLLAGENIPETIKVLSFATLYEYEETFLLFLSCMSSTEWPYDVFVPFTLYTFRITDGEQIDCLQEIGSDNNKTYIPPFVNPKHNNLNFLVDYIKNHSKHMLTIEPALDYADQDYLVEESDYIMEIIPTSLETANPFTDIAEFQLVRDLKGRWSGDSQLLLPQGLSIGKRYLICLRESMPGDVSLTTRNSIFSLGSPGFVGIRNHYKPSREALRGHSLADLGLEIDLEALKTFNDPNRTRSTNCYWLLHSGTWGRAAYKTELSSHGEISILGFEYPEYFNACEWVNALYLQGFYKPVDSQTEHYIQVNYQQYTLSELEQYQLFEDDIYLVYDITDLLPVENFANKLHRLTEFNPDYSYEWMTEVYEYLKSYEDIEIRYTDNDDSPTDGESSVQVGSVALEEIISAEAAVHHIDADSAIPVQLDQEQIEEICTLINDTEWTIIQGFWDIKLMPAHPEQSILLTSVDGNQLLFNLVDTYNEQGFIAIYHNPSDYDLSNWEELQDNNQLLLTAIPMEAMLDLTEFIMGCQ